MDVLITGGAGFIGSHVVKHFLADSRYHIYNLDKLTYAGNLNNLPELQQNENYTFIQGDITDSPFIQNLFKKHSFKHIIHLAAESHVDRSISDPLVFAKTNILGTLNLLYSFKATHQKGGIFYHISTDEVYGTLGETGLFTETSPYQPNSPYAASKASSDHFVRAYAETYGLPVIVSNCSNNYGPNQFPEKFIPVCIQAIVNNKSIPIYGDGDYTRDWLYVADHAAAIKMILEEGKSGETYNIGGLNEWKNIDLVKVLIRETDKALGRSEGASLPLITFVKDRPGHDKRYAIDNAKIMRELHWKPEHTFEEGIVKTIDWYLRNPSWIDAILDGSYQNATFKT
ncbi:dTDP-glucose 4,6-dehydratase [Flavobacteriaceae bacterium]|nr:dTDP-glucose 4,6-dehydratase [Flavobacteriaceae bacterium]